MIAWSGLVLTMAGLAQRATAPDLVLWYWRPLDPGSRPLGPFVNANHFAAWLVMAGALTTGYLVAHRRSHHEDHSSRRLMVRDWLADGRGLVLAGSLVAMLLGVGAALSRAAIFGAAVALVATLAAARRSGTTTRRLQAGIVLVALALAAAVWTNRAGIEQKFSSATTVSRMEIWRQTAPAIRDFWLTGTGAGTYSSAMLRYQRTSPDVHVNQAHSEYVQLLAEGGLLVTVPVALALFAWLRLARRRLQREVHEIFWVRAGAAAGLLATAMQGIFETPLRIPANAFLAALLAAVVVHERGRTSHEPAHRV
jgi:hypothetical protein